jgi:hypothetical protein
MADRADEDERRRADEPGAQAAHEVLVWSDYI